jgi:hypothetical protein
MKTVLLPQTLLTLRKRVFLRKGKGNHLTIYSNRQYDNTLVYQEMEINHQMIFPEGSLFQNIKLYRQEDGMLIELVTQNSEKVTYHIEISGDKISKIPESIDFQEVSIENGTLTNPVHKPKLVSSTLRSITRMWRSFKRNQKKLVTG